MSDEQTPSPAVSRVIDNFRPLVEAMEAETGMRIVQVPIELALELEKAGVIHSTGGIGWRMGAAEYDESDLADREAAR